MSSKNHILMNKNLADEAIAASKANPDVDPKASAKTLNPPGMLRSSLASGMLATQGRIEEALNGPKYRSFYNNIVNPQGGRCDHGHLDGAGHVPVMPTRPTRKC